MWALYKDPVLLIVLTPLVLFYYSGLAVQGSADDKSCVWTIALTEYVFMAEATLVVRAQTRPSSW